MIKNYLTTAIRNLRKHVFYSSINVLGLSIGLACFILITLYVTDELSYDTFHQDLEDIHRLDFAAALNGNEFDMSLSSVPAAQAMMDEFPEVVSAVRLRQVGERFIKRKDQDETFKEEKTVFADSNFFQFFDFELIQGNTEEVLKRPNTVAISETVAKKLFGNNDPLGQEVVIGSSTDYEVTGVFADMPNRSHMHFDLIFAMEGREESKSKVWMSFNFATYLKLQPGTDPDVINNKSPYIIEKYIGPEIRQFMGATLEEFEESGNYAGFRLFPMKEIHLHSDKLGEFEPNGDINYVYIFSAIAAFILLLACINFMNLATARSASRAKEVGVRKAMGAYRGQLINQFLAEAVIICLIAFLLAFGLSAAALPYFEELSSKTLEYGNLFSVTFVGGLLAVIIMVGFLAGSYPAFYLSKFRPSEVLKGKLNLGMKSGGIRSTLVVLQFTISIIMIVGTAIIYDQLSYIRNKKLGFNKDQIIMVHDAWLLSDKLDAYKNEAL
ncbi:MAG: ABC transporter permease, partial [Bacteroidota bacterium]